MKHTFNFVRYKVYFNSLGIVIHCVNMQECIFCLEVFEKYEIPVSISIYCYINKNQYYRGYSYYPKFGGYYQNTLTREIINYEI